MMLYQRLFWAALQSTLPLSWRFVSVYKRVKMETNAKLQARHREEIHPTLLSRCEAGYFCKGFELKSNSTVSISISLKITTEYKWNDVDQFFGLSLFPFALPWRLLPLAQKLVQAKCEDRPALMFRVVPPDQLQERWPCSLSSCDTRRYKSGVWVYSAHTHAYKNSGLGLSTECNRCEVQGKLIVDERIDLHGGYQKSLTPVRNSKQLYTNMLNNTIKSCLW